MTIVETTQGGYSKVETDSGNIVYKDPNGQFASQQAFAGSKAQEQYDYERDPDTGNFTGDVEKTDDTDEIEDIDGIINRRITATVSIDTAESSHSGGGTSMELEIGGVFSRFDSPTDEEMRDKIDDIMSEAYEQIPFDNRHSSSDINIERSRTKQPVGGWENGTFTLNNQGAFDNTPKRYKTDPEQEDITGF